MNRKASLLIGIALALAAAPLADARHPSTACIQQENMHGYLVGAIPWTPHQETKVGIKQQTTTVVTAWDTCDQDLDGDGVPFDYDGDMDLGDRGGRFPAGSNYNGCLENPEVSHHAYGVGAQYWADDQTGVASLIYWAGADGPALIPDPLDPCATDGIISDDPTTDPLDCADGSWGVYAPPIWKPATLGETVAGNGACDPFDGLVWVFIVNSALFCDGTLVVSTPISGHIWS